MKRVLFALYCVLGITVARAQSTTTINAGTDVVNIGAAYNLPFGFFVNNGTYTDTTSPGAMNVTGGVTYSGSGTTAVWDLNLGGGGTNDMTGAMVSVYNTATISSGVSLDAGAGNLNLRTDIGLHYASANLVNNGLLTGTVGGLVTYATATSGSCPSYSSNLSVNISGSSMVYQWESSPNGTTWTPISGATNIVYAATVNNLVYYHCLLSTSNTAYTQTSPTATLAAPTGGLSVSAAPASVSVGSGGTTVLTASGAATYTWAPATGLSATTGSSVTFTAGSSTAYTVTGTSGACSGVATASVTVVSFPGGVLAVTIDAGCKVTNTGAAVTLGNGWFINNGTYDNLTAGSFNGNAGVTFSGSNNDNIFNLNFNTAGTSLLLDQVSVYNTATVSAGTTVDANGQLWIRSDVNPATANLVVNGVLTNAVQGIITKATVTTGVSGYTSVVSANISGSVIQYQWQSSPDNSTWSNVTGATNATYTATVTSTIYYRVNTTTTNSSFTNSAQSIQLNTGSTVTFDGGSPQSLVVCQNSINNPINSLLTVTDAGIAVTETYSVTVTPLHGTVTAGTTVTSGTSVAPTGWSYTPTSGYSGTDVFTVQVDNGSNTATTVINVTVNPVPVMTVTPTSQSVCNNANTSTETFSSSVGGTTYTWANNNTTIGIGASGSGGSIASFTATNTGTSAQSGVFTVTPTAAGCVGAVQTFTITVNPTPIMSVTPTAQTVCNNANTSSEVFTSNVAGTTYTWANNNVTIGIGASGSGSTIPSFTATNSGTSAASGTFTVTPTASSCVGAVKTFTITVNPTPIMSVTPTAQTVCNNANTSSEVFTSNVAGTTYTWANNNVTIGIGASGSGSTIPSFTATNSGTSAASGTFTVTPTAASCVGPVQTFTITVNPTPIMSVTPTAQTVCNNANTSSEVFTSNVAGTTYTWANNNVTIGIGASGSGSTIPSFTATNSGTSAASGTFTVTPTAASCVGPVQTFTITVNPTPIMSVTPTAQSVCHNQNTSAEVFTSSVAGTTYTWANNNVTIGIGASGSGSTIASFTATAPTVTNIGVFTVTPTASSCVGPVKTFTITVNPLPIVTFTAQPGANTCASTNVTYTTQSGMSSYVWGLSGTNGVDYQIISGGTSISNSMTVQYFTVGPQLVSVNYTNGNGCTAASATLSTPTTIQLAPSVTSVTPLLGIPGNSVVIAGTNFNATTSNNRVWFGTELGSVTAASTSSLTVTIPNNGDYNVLTVENTSCALLGGFGGKPFLPTYNNAGFIPSTINFDPRVNFTVGSSANRIGYGDIDGDGKTDIIVNNSGTGTVSVYRNTSTSGSVSFASAVVVATGLSFPGQPSVSDLDGDGKADLVFLQASGPAQVNVFLNTSSIGSVSFAGVVALSYSTNANVSAIADIDGDGKADIIGSFLTTMSVWRNTSTVGSLSFASRVNFTSAANINYIAAGDVDGDKKPDLLVSASGTTTTSLSLWRNTSIPGTISLAARQDFTTPSDGNYVALADIDGDGKSDVLTINQSAANWSLFPNTSTLGSISLGARSDFAVGPNPSSLFIADFDGDGKPDVSTTAISASNVPVFRNTSTGVGVFTFAPSVAFASGSGAGSLYSGDIDGDGKADMVVLNQSTTTMSVFRNNPLQAITGPNQVCAGGTTLTTITLADATPNGTWSSSNTAIGSVGASTGVVTGITSGVITITYAGTAQSGPVLGNYTTYQVTVNPLPTPTFTTSPGATTCEGASVTYTTQTGETNYIWTVPGTAGIDYNIIAGGIGTGSNTVTLQWYTSGSKTVTVNYTDPNSCTNPTAATNTTTIQMAPVITSVTPLVGTTSLSIAIVGSDFNATTTNNIVYFGATRAAVTSATTTSLNVTVPVGATFTDLSVENNGCSLTAYSQKPFLQTYNNAPYVAGTVNLDPKVTFGGLTAAWGICLGDIDGDGKSDIVIGENGTSLIKVYRNTATSGVLNGSSFAAPVSFSALSVTRGIAIRDVDGDGKLDVIVEGTSSVSVFKNNSTVGSIVLAAKVDFAAGSLPNYTAVEDVDGDGKPDLIVANFSSNNVSVFRNTSITGVINSSSFATNVDFAVNVNPQGVAVADIDGDGKKDIVVSNRGVNNISVIRNTSVPGTINLSSFAAKVDFNTGSGPVGVVIADFDGDGKLDVATACNTGNVISVFRNTSTPGSITLPTRIDVPGGAAPFHQISVADMDGDGKPDLIAGQASGAQSGILRNTSVSGTISFAPLVQFLGDNVVYSVATGDLDGDNLPDVVAANQSDVVMTVYRNDPLRPITGPSTVCGGGLSGTTITLADATPNGTWTSSNTAVATVGSSTGVVTGISGGVVTITYAGTALFGPALGNYTTKTITVNPIVVAPTNSSVVCVGGLVNFTAGVTATGILTYAWSGPVGYSSALPNPGISSITLAQAGTYTLTVTSSTGCSNFGTTTVTVNPVPTTTPTNNSPVCTGGTVNLFANATAIGTMTLSWVGPTGFTSSIANPFISSVTTANAGVYIITVSTPGSGCIATAVTNVTINPTPSAAPTNSSPSCAGFPVTLTANPLSGTGVTGYSWTGPGGFTSTLANPVISPTVTGTSAYSLTVSSPGGSGCSPATIYTTIVTVNPVPAAITGNTPVCVGSSFGLANTVTGGTWTSAAPTVASVGSSTGTVSGVSGGLTTITYTLPAGCFVTTPVTINALPSSIGGTLVLCQGGSTTLTNTTSGGVWTSSVTSVVTIGSLTGAVTTGTPGNSTITYTSSAGCTAAAIFTVNASPGAISGNVPVCVLSSTTLSSLPTGGTWTSSNTSMATVGSATGIMVGVAAGNPTIVYTLPTGCTISTVATINALPAAVTGAGSICVGGSLLVSNAAIGGTWTSLAPGVAAVGSITGIVSGVGAGNATIVYTLGTGCSASAVVTVNTASGTITGTAIGCVGFTSSLSSSPAGGTWSSSNTAMATVGSTTGFVTTLAAGNPVITYTLVTGCFSTKVLTINPIPAAITGITTMCSGASSTLSSTSTGGTWSTSNPLIATVGASSGIVTGVGIGGVTTINYTLSTGCATSTSVTVNPIPGAFGGTFSGCVGYSTTLTNTATGGTWVSSSPAMATITSSGGVVATFAAGNPIMTYTMTGGCFATQMITVNPLPAAITGTLSVCSGALTTVYNTTLGGVWSSSAPATAAIGTSTGVITGGTTPGLATITYTLPTGCTATAIVTVNAQPTAITGSLALCVGASGSLSSTPSGGTWSSSNPAFGSVSTSGTLTGVSVGSPVITYTLSTGCFTTMPVTINPNPGAIAGTLAVCASGGVTTLTNSTSGGIWTSGSTSVATIGSTTGIVTAGVSGTSLITYALPTGCLTTAVVTVNTLPSSITGILSVCVGSTTTLSDVSGTSTWSSSNVGVAAIGSSTGVVNGISAGTANITFTLPTGCFTVTAVTVNPLPGAITGTTNVCTGSTVGLANATAGGTWTSSNTGLATVGSTTGIVSGGTAGTLNIIYTLPTGCLATTAFTVNQTPSVPAGPSTVCVGSSITLTSGPAGGTWTSSNTIQATVGSSTGVVNGLSAGTPTIVYTLGTGCFNNLTITVNNLPAAISGPSSVCTGSSVTLSSATPGGTWSSSTTAAIVGSGTGIVSGSTAGTTTITYTLPTGCFTTWAMTVNAAPTSISGILSVCTGFSTTLTPTPTGGTWTSSNTAEATIGSSTGVVNGITAGTPIMTYTVASGCFITAVVTVNQTPVATTGSNQVCVGFTTTLNDATVGGTWTSSNAVLATVGSSTGIVNGLTPGTLNIVYTMPTGCNVVTPVTVNANPAPLTGPSVVCPGSNITLVSSPAGGNWTSSNISIATVGSTTGIVTGVTAGAVNISYTLGTGCFASAPVTVNPAPNLASFTPPSATSPCVGGSSVVSLVSSTIGAGTFTVTYNLSGANTSTGNTVSVTFSSGSASFTIPSSLLTLTGSENVTITSITNSFGCTTNLISGNVASFAVNPLPTAFVVSGGGGYCAGGTGVHVLLSGSQVGVNYQLFRGGTPVGGAMAGTSTGLDFGLFTTAGTYTVVATNTITACVNNMTGSATVTVNPLPTAFLVTGGGSYCAGGTGVAVGLAGSQSGVNYQLFNGSTPIGSPVAGTSGSISFGLQTGGGTYTVVATNATTGCVAAMLGSVVVIVNPVPTAFTGATTICVNGTTTLASTPTGGTWTSSNTSMATVGSSSGFVTGTGPGNPTITYTLSTGCFITGVLTVNPLPASITGTLNVCVGSSTTLADATTGGLWTSSNSSLATVGSTSAIVNGVGAGVPSITYTLPTGCFVTTPFTVNPTPGAISGFSTVCTGSSITLVNGTTGGTWSSSNTAVATVGSLTGIVGGSTAGTTSIVYTLPAGGCNASFPVTVNATPAAITGTFTVCAGLTTSLSTTTTGGTWSSSNTSIATVSSTGVVSGLIAGTVTISYTMPTGCFVAASVTVNPTPAAIAGIPAVCIGGTTALTDATPGGIWTSSNTAQAPVGSLTGIVSGISVGTPSIIYTIPGGCTAVMTVTVNPNPTGITGPTNVCVLSSINLANSTPGGTWSSSNPSVASIGFLSGIVNGISAGTVNVTYTLSTGCFATANITVNPLPLSILGISNVCTGSTVTLTDASAGGLWSSSNTSLASVGSTTGVVLGVAVGTPIISYILPTGCFTTLPVVVNQTPSAITGSSLVCVGAVTTLGNAFGGGTWSSSNSSLASVNSTTGAVTGIAPGNPTITYSLPPGCIAAMTVTVMPSPAAITGTAVVCVGASTTLADVTPGGIWSSANTATATVGSTTGVVFGGTAGLVNISYTLPGGCSSIIPVTVNPLPLPITGTLNVCVGSSTTLTNASTPGVWTSSNTALATIGSITGTVNGISAGTPTITYTLPTGCFITSPFTVNPLPAAIGGSSVVCVNSTITLTNSSAGGSWTVSPITVASIGGLTGTMLGVSAGVATVVYTLPTGCTASKTVTVNPLPFLFSVTGGGAYCAGGTGVHIGLSGSATGVTYQVVFGTTPVGAALSGTGGALDFGLFTIAGTYTVVATIVSTGCSVTMTGSATVTGIALPTVYTVSGGGSYCAGGSGLAINLSFSDPGVAYQLFNGTTALGGPVAGTSSPITFGLQTLAGSYTVVATNTSTLCSSNMTGSPSIVINPVPSVFTVTGGGAYCAGGSGVHIGLSNSTVGVNYQLLLGGVTPVGSAIGGTGAAIDFGFITVAGTYTVRATNATTSCTSNMTGSVVVIVNSNPVAYAVSGGGTYCAGGTGFVISLSSSDLGVNYQLIMGGSPMGSPVAGTGFGINFGLQTSAGVYTVVATNTATGCTSTMASTATIVVNPLPAVFFVSGGGAYCSGGAGVAIGLTGSQTGVNYRLFNGATLMTTIAGTGSAISFGTFTTSGTYTVVAVNATTACTINMSGSTTITINPLPTSFTVTGGGSYCTGGIGVTVGLAGSQIGINYQLSNGFGLVGSPVAGTGVAMSFGLQTVASTYTVIATNPITGCTTTMAGSAVVAINALPTAFNVTGGGTYCTGGSGLAVGLSGSQTGVTYQLFVGTTAVGSPFTGTGFAISFGSQTLPGTYTVVATTISTSCTNNMTGSVTISVATLPVVFTVTGGGSYCAGGTGVVVGLSGSQTGVNYQLFRDGIATGSAVPGSGAALTFGLQTTAGTYTVVATNPSTTCTISMSGTAVISINPLPTAYTVTGGGSYCVGGVGVHIGLSSSDAGISYQLKLAGSPVGAPLSGTGSALDFGFITVTGAYTVTATNSTTGCTANMTGTVTVATNPLPTVFTVTGGGSLCVGGAGVNIVLSGSQSGVSYQLMNGTTPVGTPRAGTGGLITFGPITSAGTYTVIATNATTGCVNNMSGSATITVNPLPVVYAITGGGGYCAGGSGVTIGLVGSQAGVNYQLMTSSGPLGTSVAGTGSAITFGSVTIAGTYFVVATNTSTGCTANMTGTAVVVVNSAPAVVAMSGGGSYCLGGTGVHVGLAGSAVGVNYQLYKGGVPVGLPVPGIGAALDFGLQTAVGSYTAIATNATTGCSSNMSGVANVSTNPLPTVYTVSGGGSYCAGGTGVGITLSGSQTGVNYQLFNGSTAVGSPVAGTGLTLNFGLQTAAGTYTVVAANPTTTCTSNMTGSATVTINPAPTVYTVNGGGTYCSGGAGVNVGLSGSQTGVTYKLYRSGLLIGSPVSGTGFPLNFGLFTTAGTYTVVAISGSGCTSNMSGSAVIVISALPTAYIVGGGGSFCAGGSGVGITLSGSQSGVSYQLMLGGISVGSPVAGTGAAISFGLQTMAGVYTVIATNTSTGCTTTMTGSATVTVISAPVAYSVTGGGAYCSGPGYHIGLSGSSTGVTYKLYLGTTAVAGPLSGTGAALDFGAFSTIGIYTVVATSTSSSCSTGMSGTASITAGSLPTLYTVTGGGSLCSGSTGYAVGLSGSQVGVNYQLYRGTSMVGTAVAGTGSPLNFGVMTTAGGYTVHATNPTTGCLQTMTGSATIIVNPLPTAFTVTGGGSYCSGGTGVAVGLSGSSSGISYKLYRGTTLVSTVGGTGGAIAFGPQTIAGTYTVVASNISSGCTNNMTLSVTVTVNTTPTISGSIYTVAPASSITLTGSPSGGTWTSGTTAVATVGTSGVVTGIALGTSNIVYTMPTGCLATHMVSVTPTGHKNNPGTSAAIAGSDNGNIFVSPNPNKGTFIVKGTLSVAVDADVTFEITNMLGQVVYNRKVVAQKGELNEMIQLGNIANGMYLLNMHADADSKVFHIIVEQ